jgi:hypothetical protein
MAFLGMIIKFLSYEFAKILLVTEISPLSAKNFFHTFFCRLEKLTEILDSHMGGNLYRV